MTWETAVAAVHMCTYLAEKGKQRVTYQHRCVMPLHVAFSAYNNE